MQKEGGYSVLKTQSKLHIVLLNFYVDESVNY